MSFVPSAPQQPFVQPAPRVPSPLANTPISDWLRDGAALVLLLASLAMPWSLAFTYDLSASSLVVIGATRIEVVLLVVLSILSIGVTYLARFGALGRATTLGRVVGLRAAMNAPYVLLIVVYIALDAARVGDYGAVGLGASAAFGLTGALLIASPRAFEVRGATASSPVVRGVWIATIVALGVFALTVLVGLIMAVVMFVDASAQFGDLMGSGIMGSDFGSALPVPYGVIVASGIIIMLVLAAVLAVPAIFVLRRSMVALRIAGALGIGTIASLLIAAFTGFAIGGGVQSLTSGGYPLVWLAVFAALFTSPALECAMHPRPALTVWFVTARTSLTAIVVSAALLFALTVVALIASGGTEVGLVIGILLAQALSVVSALLARVQLVAAPERSRMIVMTFAGAVVLLQLFSVVLSAIAAPSMIAFWIMPVAYLIVMTLPALVIYALTAPADVRGYYAQFAPVAPASAAYPGAAHSYAAATAAQHQAPPQQAPYVAQQPPVTAAPPLPVPTPAPDPVLERQRRAADPATPAAELHAMSSDPALWGALASNPALYPALQAWLAATGDPAVLHALRTRGVH